VVDGEHKGERMEGMGGGVSVRVYVSRVSVRKGIIMPEIWELSKLLMTHLLLCRHS